ncbi:MAG: RNA polymerase sigma factor [Rubripirellula sp.]
MPRIDAASSEVPSAPHSDDRSLVERLVRGESAAWQSFVTKHGRLVRSRVADVASSFGRSKDASAIDDATAEVFAALLGNDAAALRAFAGRSSLSTYVAVIATRSATRGFARKHWTTASDSDLVHTASDQSAHDPVAELIAAEQQEKLHQLLDRLSPKQRNVVVLFHLQGMSYVEISEKLEMPIGSIGPTLRRSEAKLREWMESE